MKRGSKNWLGLLIILAVFGLMVAGFEAIAGRQPGTGFLFAIINLPIIVASVLIGGVAGEAIGQRLHESGVGAVIGGLVGLFFIFPFVSHLVDLVFF